MTPAEYVQQLRKRHRTTYDRVMGGANILDWKDVVNMLHALGFESTFGAGSRIKFSHTVVPHVLQLHFPHGGRKTIIAWAIGEIRDFLKMAGFIA